MQSISLTVPKPSAGGELLIGFEPAVVKPHVVSISQEMALVADVAVSRAAVAAVTLPAGEYQLTPLYSGGPPGERRRVTIEAGRSTFLPVPASDVGAAQLKVSDDLCVEAPKAVLWRTERYATGSTSRQIAAMNLSSQGCQPLVAGLLPGTYEVELTSPSTGLKVQEKLEITRQAVTIVSLEAPMVRLFGKLTVSKKAPAGGARLMLQPAADPDPDHATFVVLQNDGSFEARVRAPGGYIASLQSRPIAGPGSQRKVDLKEGYNELNWDIAGGVVKLDIKNWDRSSPVAITLKRRPSNQDASAAKTNASVEVASQLAARDELPATISGLELTDFVIEARQSMRAGSPRVSAPVTVSLSSDRPTAEVNLELFSYESAIKLVDGTGRPVQGAQVRTANGSLPESEPGVYPITGQHGNPGTEIQIRASGYVGMCKAAPPPGAPLTVSLGVGQAGKVRYLGRDDFSRPVGQVIPLGSDCWVPLGDFAHTLTKVSTTQVDVSFTNWPGVSVPYRIGVAYPPTQLAVGPDGIVLIQLPSRSQSVGNDRR
jgi:hypothetical protein